LTAATPGRKSPQQRLAAGVLGKIGITVSPVNPNRVWAMVEAKDGGLYRSDDGGRKLAARQQQSADYAAPVVLHAFTPTRRTPIRFMF
jgi:hypothetical protein